MSIREAVRWFRQGYRIGRARRRRQAVTEWAEAIGPSPSATDPSRRINE